MKHLNAILFVIGAVGVSAVNTPAGVAPYPAPTGLKSSDQYRVELVQGREQTPSFVYRTAAKWRTNLSKDTSWTSFAFSGPITVRVTKLVGAFTRARVLPSSRGISPKIAGQTVSFALDRPGQFAVEFDESTSHPLLVFADAPETEIPAHDDPNVVWFGPGVHDLGLTPLTVRAGQTVYLAPGAYVKGRIYGADAADVRIIGRGILSGENFPPNPPGTYTSPMLLELAGQSDRARVEGITLIDSPHYNILLRGAGSVCRNVKVMGWYFGTDGIGTGPRALVEDCFFKVNDDALKIYSPGMVVRRCVIWQLENGAPFQLSWNLNANNSRFRVSDCDVIRVEHHQDTNNRAVFNAIHGGSGHLSDYLFADIRIENAPFRLLLLTLKKTSWAKAREWGSIANLTFRNIAADASFAKRSLIESDDPAGRITGVTFENLRIGGHLIHDAGEAALDADPSTTADIRFVVP